jgi:hypothetical protein
MDKFRLNGFKRYLYIAAIILVLFVATLLGFYSNRIYDPRGRSASVSELEVENGTTQGNIQVVNDLNTSGGRYVKFGPTPTQ